MMLLVIVAHVKNAIFSSSSYSLLGSAIVNTSLQT